jgi:hypothetical protein
MRQRRKGALRAEEQGPRSAVNDAGRLRMTASLLDDRSRKPAMSLARPPGSEKHEPAYHPRHPSLAR